MDIKTFCKKFAIWTAIIGAVVMTIFHVLFFKVIEATLFEEIAKRVVVSAGVIGILEVFAYTLSQLTYHILYDETTGKLKRKKKKDEALELDKA